MSCEGAVCRTVCGVMLSFSYPSALAASLKSRSHCAKVSESNRRVVGPACGLPRERREPPEARATRASAT
eukprot:1058414-Pyramimonas_sp.AAC.1